MASRPHVIRFQLGPQHGCVLDVRDTSGKRPVLLLAEPRAESFLDVIAGRATWNAEAGCYEMDAGSSGRA